MFPIRNCFNVGREAKRPSGMKRPLHLHRHLCNHFMGYRPTNRLKKASAAIQYANHRYPGASKTVSFVNLGRTQLLCKEFQKSRGGDGEKAGGTMNHRIWAVSLVGISKPRL